MPIHTSVKRSGAGATVGAISVDLVQVPYTGLTAALMFQASCIGVDRAAPSNTVTYISGQGGGINLGIITLLPGLFGGVQKSLSLLLSNVSVSVSGGFLTLTCTGVAGRTIDWAAEVNVLAIEP